MNTKRGMLWVVVVLLVIYGSSFVLAAKCQFVKNDLGEYIELNKGLGDTEDNNGNDFNQAPDGNIVSGLVWGSIDTGEYASVQYRTLNPDCSLGPPRFSISPTYTQSANNAGCNSYQIVGGTLGGNSCWSGADGMTYLFFGSKGTIDNPFFRACDNGKCITPWEHQISSEDFVKPMGDDARKDQPLISQQHPEPVGDDEVVVGFGGGAEDDGDEGNQPVAITFEVWKIAQGFAPQNYRLRGAIAGERELLGNRIQLFLGSMINPAGPLNQPQGDLIPQGYVVTGIGTSTHNGNDKMDGLLLKARKVLVDVDEDEVWDNPDETNKDHCPNTPVDQVAFTEGEFAGCSCEQIDTNTAGSNINGYNCLKTLSEADKVCGDGFVVNGQSSNELGRVAKDVNDQEYICLNTVDVKVATGSPTTISQLWGLADSNGNLIEEKSCGKWCWVSASYAARNYIFTIHKENKFYDVISNGEEWVACADFESAGPLSSSADPTLAINANRFYCYQEWDHWSWADCRKDQLSINGIKDRTVGDGLFSLPLMPSSTPSSTVSVDVEKFKNFYTEEGFNYEGFDSLDFLVQFTPELKFPVDLQLTISGTRIQSERREYTWQKNALPYVIDNPYIAVGKWIHLRVPLPSYIGNDIDTIRLDTTDGNTISVKNMYFSHSTGTNPLCSGTSHNRAEKSVWFESADFVDDNDNARNAEDLCNALYQVGETPAWLGKEVPDSSKRCCGNNDPGSYTGVLGEGNNGCWNSQVVKNGETFTIVEINENNQPQLYTCVGTECVYPVPAGNPGAAFSNPHPELYDLYIVYKDAGNKVERLITAPFTPELGITANFVVRKISKPVLYVNNGNELGFYGCNAPDYISSNLGAANNLNYCAVKEGKVCSPTTLTPTGEVLLSSWDSTSISKVGYAGLDNTPELALKEESHAVTERTSLSIAVSAKNLIPNSNFEKQGSAVPYWKILNFDKYSVNFDGAHAPPDSSSIILTTNELNLEHLESEKIPVPLNNLLHFSQASLISSDHSSVHCKAEILRSTPGGGFTGVLLDEHDNFNTIDSQLIFIRFNVDTRIGIPTCYVKEPMIQIVDTKPVASFYEGRALNLEQNNDFRSPLSCCPQNYCWNGYVCVAPMNEFTQLVEPTTEDRNYRCIDGQWKDLPKRANWGNSETGFCAQESQCFVSNTGVPWNASQFFEDSAKTKIPGCIDNGEYLMDNYCENGQWTSRTKYLVLEMTKLLEAQDEYEFYCTAPEEALVDLESNNARQYTVGNTGRTPPREADPNRVPSQVCFKDAHKIISDSEDTCINNACVLKYKSGDEWKVAFATTVNRPLDNPESFLNAFRLNPVSAEDACPDDENSPEKEFVHCDFGPTFNGEAWYSKRLNAFIYAQEGENLPLKGTFGQNVLDWLIKLFGAERSLSPETNFIRKAQNFRDIYLMHRADPEQDVRAVKEIFTQENSIIAEYENFDTPVCEYVVSPTYSRVPISGFTPELIGEVQGKTLVACTVEGSIQRIEATSKPAEIPGVDELDALNKFWPQLTGKLRKG